MKNPEQLIEAARNVKMYSQARYSGFRVGAALETVDGEIFSGCNIESSSYGLTICAERVALTKALSEGRTNFRTIAIVGSDDDFCSPCGACRQLLHDYAPELEVIMVKENETKKIALKELLPLAFKESDLKK